MLITEDEIRTRMVDLAREGIDRAMDEGAVGQEVVQWFLREWRALRYLWDQRNGDEAQP